ncbi:MAG: hypothetical protein AAGI11_19955 [Pseudomonadota bacterium]
MKLLKHATLLASGILFSTTAFAAVISVMPSGPESVPIDSPWLLGGASLLIAVIVARALRDR